MFWGFDFSLRKEDMLPTAVLARSIKRLIGTANTPVIPSFGGQTARELGDRPRTTLSTHLSITEVS
jgi:hypothetical protein